MQKALGFLFGFLALSAFGEELTCLSVPRRLVRSAADVRPKDLGEDFVFNTSGKTLGILAPSLPQGHKLYLFQKGKRVAEYFLQNPEEKPFSEQAGLYLGEEGDVVVLLSPRFFAIYVAGSLTGVVSEPEGFMARPTVLKGKLYWSPGLPPAFRQKLGKEGFRAKMQEEDRPPILLSAELDGQGQEVLLRLSEKEVEELARDESITFRYRPLPRRDGKLWLVEAIHGEIRLLSPSGGLLRKVSLAAGLERRDKDPEYVQARKEEMEKLADQTLQEMISTHFADATKKPPRKIETKITYATPAFFSRAYTRGNGLVLVLNTSNPPPGALLLLDARGEVEGCFVFPEIFTLTGWASPGGRLAVTEDAVWFREPFGYIPWEDLQALAAAAKEKKPLGEAQK